MLQPEKINFRQTRDFGEIFNVTTKFIRQNFKAFFSSIALIAGPFILVSSIAGGIYQSSAMGLRTMAMTGNAYDILQQYGILFIVYILFAILSGLVSTGTAFSFMLVYMEKGPGNFTTSDVRKMLVKKAGRIILAFFALFLVSLPFIAILVGIGVALVATKAFVLMGFFAFALLICFGIFLPNFIWIFSAVYLIAMQEDKPIFSCIGRAFQIMRGSYWWTWLVMFCAGIVVYLIAVIFSLPQIIYQMIATFSHYSNLGEDSGSSVLFIVIATICAFLTTTVYSLLYVLCGFHYYSLAEQKDGIGLMERIDEIGNTPDANVEQQY